ncbi:MAG: 50S ribosomal protein L11 methyltransferase [Salinivirgaceae bacterium]
MNYIELQINTVPTIEGFNEILMAELGDIGFESFSEDQNQLLAYVSKDSYQESLIQSLSVQYGDFQFISAEIEQENWNAQWESNFSPIAIDDFCYIRAPFHSADNQAKHEIVIEPKMSFGTGHHATTRLMVQLMREVPVAEKKVLDMGCGTGILAILAHKLNAKAVCGIDIDEWSVENSIENAERNDAKPVEFILGGAEKIQDRFDIILANINRNILVNDMETYAQHLINEGYILFSGFYQNDVPIIRQAAEKQGLTYIQSIEEDKWTALIFRK